MLEGGFYRWLAVGVEVPKRNLDSALSMNIEVRGGLDDDPA
jgi:hypothetical protein